MLDARSLMPEAASHRKCFLCPGLCLLSFFLDQITFADVPVPGVQLGLNQSCISAKFAGAHPFNFGENLEFAICDVSAKNLPFDGHTEWCRGIAAFTTNLTGPKQGLRCTLEQL
jgi:hypothetical protein